MSDFMLLMAKPFLACLILTGIHAYLGIHVVERKVVFVDLALAQIAALGTTLALLFGFGLHAPATYWFSLGAACLGAALFAASRTRGDRIPQEAVIGIIYAVSAAAAVLLLSRAPEGDEHIRHMLVGNILLIGWRDILKLALLYGAVGLIHWKYRKTFLLISSRPEEAYASGIPVRRWDLWFYLTFAFVVTSSVEVAGVLLVFSFLVVPAVTALLVARSLAGRLAAGWGTGAAASLLGMALSYFLDLPTGASVVFSFGALLAGVFLFSRLARR